MTLWEQLTSALAQVAAAVALGIFINLGVRLAFRMRLIGKPLFTCGFFQAKKQLDRPFAFILAGIVAFAILSTALEFLYSDSLRQMLLSEFSPYGKILKNGFNGQAAVKGFIYCFIQASLAEEFLFRGVIAKRSIQLMGFARGNILQALIFWSMHVIIFRLITGEWFSYLQLLTFLTTFPLGLIFGYVNARKKGESLAPSWILHGTANYVTFLTLAVLWPK